jgi:hypothetical protein
MSALGQKQTFALQQAMSALPPIATVKADMPQTVMSALPPKADINFSSADPRQDGVLVAARQTTPPSGEALELGRRQRVQELLGFEHATELAVSGREPQHVSGLPLNIGWQLRDVIL